MSYHVIQQSHTRHKSKGNVISISKHFHIYCPIAKILKQLKGGMGVRVFLPFATTWIDLRTLCLLLSGNKSDREKEILCIEPKKAKSEKQSRMMVAKQLGLGEMGRCRSKVHIFSYEMNSSGHLMCNTATIVS